MSSNNTKEHYKMYKDGKRWVFASISVMTVMLTGAFTADSVHADATNNANSQISNDNTGNDLSQSQVVLNNKSATQDSNASSSEVKQDGAQNTAANVDSNEDTVNNKVNQDTDADDTASSNASSESLASSSDAAITEQASSNADSQNSVADVTSSVASVNSAAVATSSEMDVDSSASVNSSAAVVTSADSSAPINSSAATGENITVEASSAASTDSAAVATSGVASQSSSLATSIDSHVTPASASVTDSDIQNISTVPRTKVEPQAVSSIHVSSWQDFTSALGNKNINEIIVDRNIVGSFGAPAIAVRDNNTLLIRSNDDGRYAIDFRGAYPTGQLNLTYENIDLYGSTYFGVINTQTGTNQSRITFKNTSYTGAQLVYAGNGTTVVFQGKNIIKTVNSYSSPVDGSTISVGFTSQQALEFTGTNDYIIFDEGSTFEGSTYQDNVIRMTGNNSGITVKKGAVVTLTPHDNGTGWGGTAEYSGKANGIFMAGSGVLTVENGGTLNINAGENSSQGVAAISITDTNTTVNIDAGGTININVTGNISSNALYGQSANTAVYINGQLNTDYGAAFNVNGHNMGTFAGTLVKITGNAKLLGSTFKISLDDTTGGTGSIILLDTGGNVSIENPKDFLLHLGNNAQAKWFKNGRFSLLKARLKTNTTTTGPFKTISFTVDANGQVSVTDTDSKNIIGLTKVDEESLISLLNKLGSDASVTTLEFVEANDQVNIIDDNVTVNKESGKYLEISGYTDIPGAYIHATINGNEFAGQKLESPYWRENGVDSTVVYAAQSSMTKDPNGKGYKFTFTISDDVINTLQPGTKIDLYATHNFVDSDLVSADLGILTAQQYIDKATTVANNAKKHINQLTHLTDDQKTSLIGKITTNYSTVINAFKDDVSQNTANNEIYNNFLDDVNNVVTLSDNQDSAMNLLQTAATNTINDIKDINGLTSSQITEYENQINTAFNAASVEIGKATSNELALSAEQDGETEFNSIKNAAQSQIIKNDAVNAINEAATTAINNINNNGSLTDQEKTDLAAEVTTAANTAKNNIGNATTPDAVTSATQTGKDNINAVSDAAKLQAAKNDAVNVINEAATTAINDINNNGSQRTKRRPT